MSNLFESIRLDCKYAWRQVTTNWRLSSVVVAVLAIGIAVNTAMYTVVTRLLFARLAVHAPEQLRFVYGSGRDGRADVVSYQEFLFFRRHQRVFADAAAATEDRAFLRTSADADDEETIGEMVSANYFRLLGVNPIAGRTFSESAGDLAEEAPVVVISEHLWRTRFDANPARIGAHMAIDARDYTIVGVAPSSFRGTREPWQSSEYWVPAAQRSDDYRCDRPNVLAIGMFVVIGRLASASDAAPVTLAVRSLGERLQREFRPGEPDWSLVVRGDRTSAVSFGGSSRVIPPYLASALFIVTGMVLLIAATNVCGLLVAAGVTRTSETAIRFALGASRSRIVRQTVIEMLMQSSIGGVLAVPLSAALVAGFLSLSGGPIARGAFADRTPVPLDLSSLAFTFVLCTAVGVAVGVLSVLRVPHQRVTTGLVGSGAGLSRDVIRKLRYVVLTPQVCLACALLLAAGVFERAALRASRFDYGRQLGHLVFVSVEPPMARRCERSEAVTRDYAERRRVFARSLLRADRAAAVGALAVTNTRPFERTRASVVARTADEPRVVRVARADVSPAYFETVGIPLLQGRAFDARDSLAAPRVAIVCSALARLLWGAESPIGQYIASVDPSSTTPPKWMTVVGVVGEVKAPLGDGAINPTIYLPLEQGTYTRSVLARSDGDAATAIARVRAMIRDADDRVHVVRSGTVENELERLLSPRRLAAAILGACGLSGLLLAGIGLYGAVSYAVARRAQEMGVRLALGATYGDVIRLAMKDGVLAASAGLAGGTALALLIVRLISATIWPIPDSGYASTAIVLAILFLVVVGACYLPARRVTRIEPVDVLRTL